MKFEIAFLLGCIAVAVAEICDLSNAIDLAPIIQDAINTSQADMEAYKQKLDRESDLTNSLAETINEAGSSLSEIGEAGGRIKRTTSSGLDCSSSETCFGYNGDTMCLDPQNLNWRDGLGSYGNLADGNYTLADGRTGNIYVGPYPYPGDGSTPGDTFAVVGQDTNKDNTQTTDSPNSAGSLSLNKSLIAFAFSLMVLL